MSKYSSILLFLVLTTFVVGTISAGISFIQEKSTNNDSDCHDDEVSSDCGRPCQETCTYKPEVCITVCSTGCFCKPGLVRSTDEDRSKCISREECPEKH